MRRPLSLVPVGLHMEYFESELLPLITNFPLLWLKYVDDILIMWWNEDNFEEVLSEVNSLPHIVFGLQWNGRRGKGTRSWIQWHTENQRNSPSLQTAELCTQENTSTTTLDTWKKLNGRYSSPCYYEPIDFVMAHLCIWKLTTSKKSSDDWATHHPS